MHMIQSVQQEELCHAEQWRQLCSLPGWEHVRPWHGQPNITGTARLTKYSRRLPVAVSPDVVKPSKVSQARVSMASHRRVSTPSAQCQEA